MMTAVNLEATLKMSSDHWSPKIVASCNGHDVMVVKVQGEFIWHSYLDTDDFFLLPKSNLTIQPSDGDVRLGPGDLYIVPKGGSLATARARAGIALTSSAGAKP